MSLEAVYRESRKLFIARARRLVSPMDAEDVVQATFVRAIEHGATDRSAGYLFSMLRRVAADWSGPYGHAGYQRKVQAGLSAMPPPPRIPAEELMNAVLDMEKLPEDQRAAVVGKAAGYTLDELGRTRASVQGRLHRARTFLRDA